MHSPSNLFSAVFEKGFGVALFMSENGQIHKEKRNVHRLWKG
jgi:hypothetical protein